MGRGIYSFFSKKILFFHFAGYDTPRLSFSSAKYICINSESADSSACVHACEIFGQWRREVRKLRQSGTHAPLHYDCLTCVYSSGSMRLTACIASSLAYLCEPIKRDHYIPVHSPTLWVAICSVQFSLCPTLRISPVSSISTATALTWLSQYVV